ncbi:MAG: ATP-binding cassette domain-containing protein [Treponema sp.]|jgi:ABC-2 type transport system ATP-binding protein|nr:ATP-binding cassette domain-containing protein [Treponema sp.]
MNNAVIKVHNLTKRYKGASEAAVDNISFSVGEGEFFAFLGQNGAGKTTTISILTTTLAKTSGDITIAGYDIDREAREVRKNIGIIFQKPSLDLDISAEENIRLHACLYGMYGYRPFFKWMPKAYRDRVIELADIMGIADKLNKPLKTFSGGMQRKIEIIRSLVHQPAVLFLDEPTQGLDPVSRRDLWNYINTTRKEHGTTVFLTTHYIDEAENVDKLCMIQSGKIVFSGKPKDLKQMSQSASLEDAYIELLTEGRAA